MRQKVLTVIIRDESPVIHLNEPVSFRTVQIVLTKEQVEKLEFLHREENISMCFIEGNKELIQ